MRDDCFLFSVVFGIAKAVVDDVGTRGNFGFVGDDEIQFGAVFDDCAVAYAHVISQDDFSRVSGTRPHGAEYD